MEDISSSCSWADAYLSRHSSVLTDLPIDLRTRIIDSVGSQYLDALTTAARLETCTDQLFALYKPVFIELVARRITPTSLSIQDDLTTLSCLARILPFCSALKPQAKDLLSSECLRTVVSSYDATYIHFLDQQQLQNLLLALFRLLSFDRTYFDQLIDPVFLTSLLHHESLPVRYLAIECLCSVLHFADAFFEDTIQTYIGKQPILGVWEGKNIDFRLMKLWEEHRWKNLNAEVEKLDALRRDEEQKPTKFHAPFDFSPCTALIGEELFLRPESITSRDNLLVLTSTAQKNLNALGKALSHSKPVLVIGKAGSGKTALIQEAAGKLDKLSKMVTLHLNEQTDAKSLLGFFTSSASGESFEWRPGVLTKAVQEGRWVLIEDIDRAPAEVLGILRPVIENGDLFLPSRKEQIRSEDGFRVLATMRNSGKDSRAPVSRHAWLNNERLWTIVETKEHASEEVSQLVARKYQEIEPISKAMLAVHVDICSLYDSNQAFKAVSSRLPSLRDLLKWCRRIEKRVQAQGVNLRSQAVPETFQLDLFNFALDCYASHLSQNLLYHQIGAVIARNLNISPQQMQHCLNGHTDAVSIDVNNIKIGRTQLRRAVNHRRPPRTANFANTRTSMRALESVAAGVEFAEPYLLVGETGVGKTTLVQYVANLVGQQLTVVNLSQQSEATDLLGGLKPITTRSLILPLVETFNTLFDDTFSASRNEKFQIAISKAVVKQNWSRLLMLWQEAVQLAGKTLKSSSEVLTANGSAQPSKKRRLATPKYEALRDKWHQFSSSLRSIQAQVDRGDKGHAFAFVEGRLVQAVRNGEWLLLDEINLAASDALDHIVSLLHNGDDEIPSILLTEAGNIEQVYAHPDFRIFAAMNPATDSGKKDLAPALRSRFTEVFVHSGDKDIEDLVKIIQVYLGDILQTDRRAASDLANAYLALNRLNEERRLSDGAGDIPHFSIRSLVRCLLYVLQNGASYGLRRAMYEGFEMSCFTVLSRQSEQLAAPIISRHLLSNVKNVRSFLSQIPKVPDDGHEYVAFKHHLVAKGPVTPDLQQHYILTPSVERNLLNLARAASMRRFPILLQGPTSAGKTSMIEYLSKLSGNKFVRINNHEHTDLQEYLGSYASDSEGKLRYKEGVLVDALRQGHWIVLDELNLAPSDVLEALNRLLDDNRELLIPESQEVVRPHPNFMLFATQNPAGLYGGRKRLSRAFRNRFLELHFDDIPESELEIILKERAQIAPSYCAQIVAVYKKLSLQRQSARLFEQKNSFATLRDLFRWASRPLDDRQQLANHGFMLLAERVRDPAERVMVKKIIEETIKVTIDENTLYGQSALGPSALEDDNIVWTSAMRRLFVLVSSALRNNEPVLLVGETGCGKTQICQVIAKAFGRNLNIYNAHTNTETGDLIGSQRPIRSRSELAGKILDNIQQLVGTHINDTPLSDFDVSDLITQFSMLDTSNLDQDIVTNTKASIGAYRSLFIWNDGSLVRSMKSGEIFLLDEISLADDSVLERLNSVLEPSRTILLAEKGSMDNLVIADPSFQFLATMNPGGDYGKRELSAALRNRLTEIWVPSLSQEYDVVPIVEAKLHNDSKYLAKMMIKFAMWIRTEFSSSTSTVIPLRDLLAWANFVGVASNLPTEIAFVHGAALVYIDSLGANPSGLIATSATNVKASRDHCLKHLQTLISVNVANVYFERPALKMNSDTVQVGSFALTRSSDSGSSMPDLVFQAPTTLMNTMRIVRALQMGRAILLEGNPGVGKTAIVTALAHALGKSLTRINLSDQTDIMDLFGTDAPSENEHMGSFSWTDGPLLKAMQTGGWVLLDEMNLASQSVLEGLNSCLDHRKEVYIAELDKTFTCHPDFFLFAAQNPHHQGGGRKGLPASFVNRFTVVYADPLTIEDLMFITHQKTPEIPESSLDVIVQGIFQADQLVSEDSLFTQGGPWEFNLRDANRWLSLYQDDPGVDPMYHFNTIIGHRFRTSTQATKIQKLTDVASRQKEPESYYNLLNPNHLQVGLSLLRRDSVQQSVDATWHRIPVANLPQAKSTITAISHNWPVVFVGSSGSGKTNLIRSLAATSGADLVEISMNADLDTMDLLGGFEQYDKRSELVALKQDIRNAVLPMIQQMVTTGEGANANGLLSLLNLYRLSQSQRSLPSDFHAAMSSLPDSFQRVSTVLDRISQFNQLDADAKSRFVWNDGILIDALERGAWVVLDNANLCNASVLDRLNSLLEPNGHLVISEQHNAVGGSRIVKPHPNFRIFLTVDPRYGELSRAMRNRSLEIFMPDPQTNDRGLKTIQYSTSSRIDRLRQAFNGIASGIDIEPFFDNLSYDDADVLRSQLSMMREPSDVLLPLQSVLDERSLLDHNVWLEMSKKLSSLAIHGQESDSQIPVLPQLVSLNGPRLAALVDNPNIKNAEDLTHAWRFQIRVSQLLARLQTCVRRVDSVSQSQLSVLEKSIHRRTKNKRAEDSVLPVYPFSVSLLQKLSVYIHEEVTNANYVKKASVARLVLHFIADLMEFCSMESIDPAFFQTILIVGKDLLAQLSRLNRVLANEFDTALRLFGSTYETESGRSLQRMWPSWKPQTPSSLKQLETKLALEQLTRQFDNLLPSLPQSRQELVTVKGRLLDASTNAWQHDEAGNIVEVLSSALEGMQIQSARKKPLTGQFQAAFDLIHHRRRLFASPADDYQITYLSMFGSNNTSQINSLVQPQGIGNTLQRLPALRGYYDVDGSRLSGLLISRLSSTQDQTLRSLYRAKEELRVLTKTICEQPSSLEVSEVEEIADGIRALLGGILSCHRDFLTPEAASSLSLDGTMNISQAINNASHTIFNDNQEDSKYFQGLYQDHLSPAISLLAGNHKTSSGQSINVGRALFHVSIAALKLMVPERAFDPALLPVIVHDRHKRRVAELEAEIRAQRQFHRQVMGQHSSMLIRLLERELAALTQPPSAPVVLRPEVSEFGFVQEEFSNIWRSLLSAMPYEVLLEEDVHEESVTKEVIRLNANIDRVVSRLMNLNRAYDDLVQPVIQLLNCLGLSTELIATSSRACIEDKLTSTVSKHVPLLGSLPDQVCNWPSKDVIDDVQLSFLWLQHNALLRQFGNSQSTPIRSESSLSYLDILDRFYFDWKQHLSKDQVEAETKSRYYSYRGDATGNDEAEQREMSEMFPDFEQTNENDFEQPKPRYNSREIAIQVVAVHERIFDMVQQNSLSGEISHCMALLSESSPKKTASIPITNVLPGILMLLDSKARSLQKHDNSRSFNIYSDSNIDETQKLVKLVETIQNRFYDIADRWPEHAVPGEVINFTDQLLEFKLNDPLAKLLTKTEKLLEIMAQWQSVASREWSVASLMDELTALIISWRRLELSSWSRLLDIEKEKSDENARYWYFIAYEAVLVNSRNIVDQVGDIPAYCQELAGTLEGFFKASSQGQYAPRLKLLEVLNKSLSEASEHDQRLEPISHCVSNVISHYSRYECHVQKLLRDGRTELEKAVMEQIKLASWKDTNITALRDSAKRSHNKLFRIVKKYRTLLEQPIASLKAEDIQSEGSLEKNFDLITTKPNEDILKFALATCKDVFPNWQDRPDRLSNPVGAALSMRKVYSGSQPEFSVAMELAFLRDDLKASIEALRKETPPMLTEDNTSLVKHLRERKRKLLADTVKSVSHMGIRKNLATTELLKQSSLAIVLSTSPDLPQIELPAETNSINLVFHELLDVMSQVRIALTDHSSDLTEGEVRRSVGLLEGFLFVVTKQRNDLYKSVKALRELSEQNSQLLSLSSQIETIVIEHTKSHAIDSFEQRLSWLPAILNLSCTVLEIQEQYGESNKDELIDSIRSFADNLHQWNLQLTSQSALPQGLVDQQTIQLKTQIDEAFRSFQEYLRNCFEKDVNVKYLISKLIPWLEPIDTSQGPTVNGVTHSSLEDIDHLARTTADSVFVALQQMSSVKHIISSTEDVQWLTNTDKAFSESIRNLHISEVSQKLRAVLAKLQYLQPTELTPAIASLAMVAPIIDQFYHICANLECRRLETHMQTCRLALFLAKTFTTLSSEGFCSPAEKSDGQEQSGKLESGTGLGEGEGAEDISKDVGDDEDLSELAQAAENEKKDNEVENAEDAVDMGADEIQGETGDYDEQKSGDEKDETGSEDEANEMDEETGSVDDLDPTAVDEKMWDDAKNEQDDKELKSDKAKGSKSKDQTVAEDGQNPEEDEIEGNDAEEGVEKESDDEGEGVGKAEADNTDPHLQEEKALDLPEELQLTGEDEMKDDDMSDDGMDDLSDIEKPEAEDGEEVDQIQDPDVEKDKPVDDESAVNEENPGEDLPDGAAEEDEIMEDQLMEKDMDDGLQTRDRETQHEIEESGGGESGAANQLQDEIDEDQQAEGQNRPETDATERKREGQEVSDNQQQGEAGTNVAERGVGRDSNAERKQDEALRKLADVLDQWHQRREIFNPSRDPQNENLDNDIDMAEADFEHVEDEDNGDAQALGATNADQAQNLDQSRAIQDENQPTEEDTILPDVPDEQLEDNIFDRLNKLQARSTGEQRENSAIFSHQNHPQDHPSQGQEIDTESLTEDMTFEVQHLDLDTQQPASPLTTPTDAAQLWNHCSNSTHQFSLILSEQLRLILSPTTATKLRGDFRTGKRLNLKRIIPYIASGYKRDKIWMRRSIPSKRNYQIMIAVDDSKSMSESGADLLAFESLAMLCKSLSMLEVGELCVVSFGEEEHIRVAHPFSKPFTNANECGTEVFRNFTFRQKGTDVRKLIAESTALFQDARLQTPSSSSLNQDLWQLQLILSDGHCSDHDAIRRLVLHAQSLKIMIVFVIVDAPSPSGPEGKSESILDMKAAIFEPDPDPAKKGEMKVVTRRYLESFPFPYYLVVRDVRDLPGVLATALKGWFGSVVDVQ